jgi:formylglycine-generating enzyme required for sulfatase activity
VAATGETQTLLPVENVSWYRAIAFCNKLSILDSKTPVYKVSGSTDLVGLGIPTSSSNNATCDQAIFDTTANGYRLPTDMEFLWAWMGGTKGATTALNNVRTKGYQKGYSGSQEGSDATSSVGNYAWYRANSGNNSHQVGLKTANELGLYDMSGNVMEWCWGWHEDFSGQLDDDYQGAVSGSFRVKRGGSWYDDASLLRSASRLNNNPSLPYSSIGFRLVRP